MKAEILSVESMESDMKKRADSYEKYILDLISKILNCPYEWQKTFSSLVGDFCKDGRTRKLAIDGYFNEYSLIVEYREIQQLKQSHLWTRG